MGGERVDMSGCSLLEEKSSEEGREGGKEGSDATKHEHVPWGGCPARGRPATPRAWSPSPPAASKKHCCVEVRSKVEK